jgi:hypothetical protein
MHIGSAMTENVPKAGPEYAEDVLVVGFPESFTNSLLSSSCPRQALVHNFYFSALIMFVCALSFEEKDLHHLM